MAYATQSDLVPARVSQLDVVQLTDDTNSGQVNPAVVQEVLDEASGVIEGYCRARYQVPLQPSIVLTSLTCDIAVYKLFKRKRNVRMKDEIRQDYEDALLLLKDISAGRASFDQPVADLPQTSTGGPEYSTKKRRFRESNIQGFV